MFNSVRENIDFIPCWLKCEHAIFAERAFPVGAETFCGYLQNPGGVLQHIYYTLCFC